MANPNPPASGIEREPSPSDLPRASDAFERALLDSARGDVVRDGARGRVALALGIGVPVGGLDSANSRSANVDPPNHDSARFASAGHARSGDTLVAGGGPLALAGKVALVSLAGGLVALLLVGGAKDPGAAATGMVSAPRAPAALSLPAPSSGQPRPNEPPARPPARLDVSEAAAPRAASRSPSRAQRPALHAAPPPSSDGESRLLAEVARLDQARAALAGADRPRALQHIERYRAEFPNGALAREAARIEARARAQASGSIGQARDIGEAR
jgi:hypothetical protein